MNHKRKRSRNRRAGCKLCKPWKVNGYRTERLEGEKFSDHRRRSAAEEDLRNLRNLPPVTSGVARNAVAVVPSR